MGMKREVGRGPGKIRSGTKPEKESVRKEGRGRRGRGEEIGGLKRDNWVYRQHVWALSLLHNFLVTPDHSLTLTHQHAHHLV